MEWNGLNHLKLATCNIVQLLATRCCLFAFSACHFADQLDEPSAEGGTWTSEGSISLAVPVGPLETESRGFCERLIIVHRRHHTKVYTFQNL